MKAYWWTDELVKLLTSGISDKASRRNKLDAAPPALSGTGHLHIGLGIILGIRQLRGHLLPFAQEPVKAGDGMYTLSAGA